MEFILICLLVAAIGGVLGFLYGKRHKNQSKKISTTVRWCLGILLGLLMSRAFDWNLGICMILGLLSSEAIGISFPKKS